MGRSHIVGGLFGSCNSSTTSIKSIAETNPANSIQTWALEEARRRLEAEGILADPDTKKD